MAHSQASKAARRWGALTAMTTLVSPISRRPVRCTIPIWAISNCLVSLQSQPFHFTYRHWRISFVNQIERSAAAGPLARVTVKRPWRHTPAAQRDEQRRRRRSDRWLVRRSLWRSQCGRDARAPSIRRHIAFSFILRESVPLHPRHRSPAGRRPARHHRLIFLSGREYSWFTANSRDFPKRRKSG